MTTEGLDIHTWSLHLLCLNQKVLFMETVSKLVMRHTPKQLSIIR